MGVASRLGLVLAGAATVVLTGAACRSSCVDFLLLVGGHVLRAIDVALVLWSIGVLVAAGTVMMIVLGRGRGAGSIVVAGLLAVVVVTSGAWCVGRAVVVTGLAALGRDAYTVVVPPPGEGCVLIAHEDGVLRTSSGTLSAVGPVGLARPTGSWTADEVDLPVRNGAYSLRWDGSRGSLTLAGSEPVRPTRLDVPCPR